MMKLLIVDDHAEMRQVLINLFGDSAEVYECSDGAEAFSAYEKYRPDWVLMDIKMSGMNGIVATKRIIASYPQARIAIVTGYEDMELREAARLAGACEYVIKPNLIRLREVINARSD